MPENFSIVASAILKKHQPSHLYQLIIRWNLKLDGTSLLPAVSDEFFVHVSKGRSHDPAQRIFLRPDGTWGAIGEIIPITVKPQIFAMLQTPQEHRSEDFYYDRVDGQAINWMVGVAPTLPIDEHATDDSTIKIRGFGVSQLLKGVDPVRALELGYHFFYKKLRASVPSDSTFSKNISSNNHLLSDLALEFARISLYSDDGPVRSLSKIKESALTIQKIFVEMKNDFLTQKNLSRYASILSALYEESPIKASFESYIDTTDVLQFVSFINFVSNSTSFTKEELSEYIEIYEVPRKAIGVMDTKFLSGGRMLDFWHADMNQRGRQVPASELVGLGLTIGSFPPQELEEMIANQEAFVIEVIYPERLIAEDVTGQVKAEFVIEAPIHSNPVWLRGESLQSALNPGSNYSSNAVCKPSVASISYDLIDMVIKREQSQEQAFSYEHATGDQHLRLRVELPKSVNLDRQTVAGFNIYGVWEPMDNNDPHSNELKRFFSDPLIKPTLAELKPWLITKYYGYEQDLKNTFPIPEHPNLVAALENPPYKAMLLNAFDEGRIEPGMTSNSDEKGVSIPQPLLTELFRNATSLVNIYTLDIRKGMKYGTKNGETHLKGWDMMLPPNYDWSPEKDRFGRAVQSPQRYRFWVTSVDWFEQESEPVAVLASSAGEETSYFYSPRYRIPLSSPIFKESKSLAFDKSTRALTVRWETPYLNRGREANHVQVPAMRINPDDIFAHLKIFRRRLVKKQPEPQYFSTAEISPTYPFNAPQWENAIAKILQDTEHGQGWMEFSTIGDIDSSKSTPDHTWTVDVLLQPNDLGYEYIALLGATVTPAKEPFWLSNNDERIIRYFEAKQSADGANDSYTPKNSTLREYPRASAVVKSNLCVIPNDSPAKGIDPQLRKEFQKAKPVLPVPSIDRDRVLLKILNYPVTESNIDVARTHYRDTAELLTPGQQAMLDSAIVRSGMSPDSPELHSVRKILSQDFRNSNAQHSQVQYSTVGFRGITRLLWSYKSVALSSADERAEAIRFRIYLAKIPIVSSFADRNEELIFLTKQTNLLVNNVVVQSSERCTFSATDDQPQYKVLEDLHKLNIPTSIILTDFTGNRLRAGIKELTYVKRDNRADFILELKDVATISGARPTKGSIAFVFAHEVYQVDNRFEDSLTDHSCYLPVAGGEREVFTWTVVGVSAQEVASILKDQVSLTEEYQSTIMPPPAVLKSVRPPGETDYYEADARKRWAPTLVNSTARAKDLPRIVLEWNPSLLTADTYLAIEREQKNIAEESDAYGVTQEISAWEALREIQSTTKEIGFTIATLDAVKQWLEGEVVKAPDDHLEKKQRLIGPESVHLERKKYELPAVLGTEPNPQIPPESATVFIDYFLSHDDLDNVMTSDWVYRYRLINYINIGTDKNPIALESAATPWTEYVRPDATPIKVEKSAEKVVEVSSFNPSIAFSFRRKIDSRKRIARLLSKEFDMFFRIQVRRKVTGNLTNPGVLNLRDVDRPLFVRAGDLEVQSATIIDTDIERSFPDSTEQFEYEVLVQEFAMVPDHNGGFKEDLIRKQKEVKRLNVTVPPATTDVTEKQILVELKID